mmetsp:Transcript_26416/g.27458  ORF Transcript_26416/g.27458 Transcript_26416/m.27458 type:complete len:138 (-) Transcript_26416:16-429(-)
MKAYSLDLKYRESLLPVQVIQLKDSFFIYIGTQQLKLDNLTFGLYVNRNKSNAKENTDKKQVEETSKLNSQDEGLSCSTLLLDNIYSENAKFISERLSKKFQSPIFLSLNIPDNYINLEFKVILESSLSNFLTSIII